MWQLNNDPRKSSFIFRLLDVEICCKTKVTTWRLENIGFKCSMNKYTQTKKTVWNVIFSQLLAFKLCYCISKTYSVSQVKEMIILALLAMYWMTPRKIFVHLDTYFIRYIFGIQRHTWDLLFLYHQWIYIGETLSNVMKKYNNLV